MEVWKMAMRRKSGWREGELVGMRPARRSGESRMRVGWSVEERDE